MTGAVVRPRPALLLVGSLYLLAAVSLQPPYPFANLVADVPWLWEAVFGAAAATCLGCAWTPPGRALQFASFLLVMVAAGSRALALWAITPHAVEWLPPPNAVPWLIACVFQWTFWLGLVGWGRHPQGR